jgi:type I restriction enzyme M protein
MHTVKIYSSKQANKHFSREEKVLGQFFTPPQVADFIVSFALNYISEKKVACDPACGDGVFLYSLIRYGFKPLGVDIDEDVVKLMPEEVRRYVCIGDGLRLREEQKFDLVVGNPPFSSKYGRVKGDILKEFELGKDFTSQAIEILFLEKFIRLCKEGGVVGIILPHGIFSDMRLSYVREYIKKHLNIISIISLPRHIFRVNKTSSKTCILIGKKGGKTQKILFGEISSISELTEGNIKKKTFATPEEFLYPEFYLERNQILEGLPKLKDFKVEIIQGSAKYGDKRKFASTGIPFISAKTITSLGIDFSKDKKFIEPGGIMDNKRAHVQIGDVVFVRVGVGCIGRCAVITEEREKGIVDDWIYIIRVKDERLNPFFLAFWLQTDIMQKEIRRLARGVGTITIPISLVKELPIMLPSQSLLKECEEKYYEMIKNRKNNQIREALKIKDEICVKLELSLL